MASFSFGAGNAQKLARLPLYGIGRLVTLVTPRTGRWVFGCGSGIADGALALWREAEARGIDAVWLTTTERERADAERAGIPTIPKMSWRGFWATARARVAVVTHGFGDVNPFAVSGAFVAQLWHGIPLKRIGLDAPELVRSAFLPKSALVRRLIGWMYRRSAQRIGVLPAASHLVRARLESAFGIGHDRIAVTGEPRVDVIATETAEQARAIVANRIPGIRDESALLLYAPTWRDGNPDPGVPSEAEWREIAAVLDAHDAVLIVRSHRLGEGEYAPGIATDRIALLGADQLADITPAIP
ncbi:MAG: CDP-glycerol glycerophosphotransferase family protein, partial [Candidatus Microbacterium stercoravium]